MRFCGDYNRTSAVVSGFSSSISSAFILRPPESLESPLKAERVSIVGCGEAVIILCGESAPSFNKKLDDEKMIVGRSAAMSGQLISSSGILSE